MCRISKDVNDEEHMVLECWESGMHALLLLLSVSETHTLAPLLSRQLQKRIQQLL